MSPGDSKAASAALVGWSDVGLHETDGRDVSVYSLMPPYNSIHAQLISAGLLVTNAAGITVTYQAVADSSGSINTTSQGKGNFYQFAQSLHGVALIPDQGLAGFGMPGPANQPQPMAFDPAQNWFAAQGIPITPYDDQGRKNSYPMMRLVARNNAGTIIATTDIVLPVTDEMDCRACHASGTQTDARPMAGWEWNCDPDKDHKLNILLKHDDHFAGTSSYSNVLSQVGYNTAGLAPTVLQDGKPILCIRCHPSAALPGSGAPGMRPFTQLMHTKHAYVQNPTLGLALNNMNTSAACLDCHAGPETRYQRGAHRNTVNTNGSLAMQCQTCHGTMTAVGTAGRKGWLDEPNCQSCHTGTATNSGGLIRYATVFDGAGKIRLAADATFATQTNTPAAGLALFRSSQGHGGLKCAACHGSTHAELSSSQTNDNAQSLHVQGHAGVLADCAACHVSVPTLVTGGPHGLHPMGQTSFNGHGEGGNSAQCQVCHGVNSVGTALSRSRADRTLNTTENGGARPFWQGFQIGCYECHAGTGGNGAGTTSASATSRSATTTAETPVTFPLQASDSVGRALTLRVVSPPAHGSVSLSNSVATYFPARGYVGGDSFTFAAWNGFIDSNLGTVTLAVNPGACALTATATAPTAALPNSSVPFRASAALAQCVGTFTYDWDFGDGSPHASLTNVCHPYAVAGDYAWTLKVTANGVTQSVNGVVTISPTLGPPLPLTITSLGFMMVISWPADRIPVSVETSLDLSQPYSWQPLFDTPMFDGVNMTLWELVLSDQQYFRLRRVP